MGQESGRGLGDGRVNSLEGDMSAALAVGGGVLSYIRSDIPNRRRPDIEACVITPVEILAIECAWSDVMYRMNDARGDVTYCMNAA